MPIIADDIKPSWSALKWVKIADNSPIPVTLHTACQSVLAFADKCKNTGIKYYMDLFKQ